MDSQVFTFSSASPTSELGGGGGGSGGGSGGGGSPLLPSPSEASRVSAGLGSVNGGDSEPEPEQRMASPTASSGYLRPEEVLGGDALAIKYRKLQDKVRCRL